jgi:hypothetical protein
MTFEAKLQLLHRLTADQNVLEKTTAQVASRLDQASTVNETLRGEVHAAERLNADLAMRLCLSRLLLDDEESRRRVLDERRRTLRAQIETARRGTSARQAVAAKLTAATCQKLSQAKFADPVASISRVDGLRVDDGAAPILRQQVQQMIRRGEIASAILDAAR